ncbi:hypothetical protein EDB19DRAFT_2045013 [Suillus lakei]|nr:hypothetical protein EDB19DRAFT_2045013 [Suillus lakei]
MLNIVVTGVDTAKSSIQFLIAVVRNTLDNVTLQSERSRWWNPSQRICQYGHWEEDAKEQGRKKKQSGTLRDTFYSQVAQAEDPKAFIKPVSTRFSTLRKKYNEFNKDLKQSGAGKTYAELQEDPKMKSLIDTKLEKFPWWPELHGWWQTNPAFNYVFSTADAGQDFASAALEHFNLSKQLQPLATGDDDTHTDDDPEDGEIVEICTRAMDDAGVSLHISSLKGSHESSPSLAAKQSRASTQSASPQSSCPPSSSRKRPGSSALDQTSAAAERMSQTVESLMTHLDSKHEGHVEQDRYKRMKLESEEHAMRLAAQDHLHQQERMTQQIEFARIEIELSRAHQEEEEARIRHIAMECGLE